VNQHWSDDMIERGIEHIDYLRKGNTAPLTSDELRDVFVSMRTPEVATEEKHIRKEFVDFLEELARVAQKRPTIMDVVKKTEWEKLNEDLVEELYQKHKDSNMGFFCLKRTPEKEVEAKLREVWNVVEAHHKKHYGEE